jgi:hypothetical protein
MIEVFIVAEIILLSVFGTEMGRTLVARRDSSLGKTWSVAWLKPGGGGCPDERASRAEWRMGVAKTAKVR